MRQVPGKNQKEPEFLEEIQILFHQRLFVLFWVAFMLFPLFSLLDFVVVPDLFREFLFYRILCSLLMLLILAVYYSRFGKEHPFATAMAGYLICGFIISLMVVKMGGYSSFYYIGIICILVAFSSILPLTLYQSVYSGMMLYLLYLVPVLLFNKPDEKSMAVFINNNFFFMFFLAISTVNCHEEYKSRLREYKLRRKLDYHARNLENKVVKRTRKLEESELRYRELYDNIIDRVVLVDTEGLIRIANPSFYRMMAITGSSVNPGNIKDFLHSEDRAFFTDSVMVDLKNRISLTDCQFRLVNRLGEVVHIECNAKSLAKGKNTEGYQFVIRDISKRKKLEHDLIQSLKKLRNTKYISIMGLAKLTEYRDKETGRHLERIQEYSRLITQELALLDKYKGYINDEYINDIYHSSILHDIGKVAIPDSILLKPSRLTPEEFEVIKLHCKFGGDALKELESQIDGTSYFSLGKEIAYYHHEKWDGTGYLENLKGTEIPLSARIVALTDVYDALTAKRIYKDAYPHQVALDMIESERGTHFDPDIVDAFLVNAEKFREIKNCLKN